MATSLQTTRREIGFDLNECHVGTLSTPTNTSFIDESLIDYGGSGDEKIIGAWVLCNGQVRRVARCATTLFLSPPR